MAVPWTQNKYSYNRRIQAVIWLVLDNNPDLIDLTYLHYSPTQWFTHRSLRKIGYIFYDSSFEDTVADIQEFTIALSIWTWNPGKKLMRKSIAKRASAVVTQTNKLQDLDKQTRMADDSFFQTRKPSVFQNRVLWKENFTYIPSIFLRTYLCCLNLDGFQ